MEKILYFDCAMGAAGDMLSAALLELMPDREKTVAALNEIGIEGVTFVAEEAVKCGITGTHLQVLVRGEEEESHDVCMQESAHQREQIQGCGHTHDYEPSHAHEPDHDHEPSHVHEPSRDHEPGHDHEPSRDHEPGHDHEPSHAHEPGHDHEPSHAHEPSHDHDHHHSHHHATLAQIEHIVSHLHLSGQTKEHVLAVYRLIAQAEGKAHGKPVSEIHFHEVGTMDAVADITAFCYLMEQLAPDKVVVSPIHVGSGHVHCAHGILPVPAPATAYILQEVPIYGGRIQGELCTPTGAALLKHFATAFGNMPVMQTKAIGYGMGKKDFEAANCVRVFYGESAQERNSVAQLECNLDDMTAEQTGFAMEVLLEAGALDVYTVPVGMKKNRPATMLCVLCKEEDAEKMAVLLLQHTTTLGVRKSSKERFVLERRIQEVGTPYGTIRKKIADGYGIHREKYEYEDLSRIAREKKMSLTQLLEQLEKIR